MGARSAREVSRLLAMYTLDDYRKMAADRGRIEAYAAALKRCVTPGTVVADIGTGTGNFTLLACRYGARRVYAIEPADIIHLAQALVSTNGYADRVVFIQDLSTRVTLPERVNVIVSDLRGVLPWFGGHIPAIADARERLLAVGGVLIPRQDTVWAAPVEGADLYHAIVNPWDEPRFELDFSPAHDAATEAWVKASVHPDQLLATPGRLALLDYRTGSDARLSAEAQWGPGRPGRVHGFAVWFDTVLLDDIGFSNAPGQPERVYGCGFFPLKRPVAVSPGDQISLRLQADPAGEDYLWRWETSVRAGQSKRIKAAFDQSNFAGTPRAAAELRRRSRASGG